MSEMQMPCIQLMAYSGTGTCIHKRFMVSLPSSVFSDHYDVQYY